MATRVIPVSRRDLMRSGLAAGLVGCAGREAAKGDDTAEVPREPGRVDHVIVVMMENRSFDHYLGALSLEEGRADVDGLTGDEVNLDDDGVERRPFHLTESCQLDPPHSWSSSRDQFNDGANDGFVSKHDTGETRAADQSDWVMGYYGRDDLPAHYALADQFCVPDRLFCSVMGPTWPNRFYGQTATSLGMTGNTLPPGSVYDQRSIYQALTEVGEDWRYYYVDLPFVGLLADHLGHTGVRTIERFHEDVAAGDLPAFTWIDPGFTFADDHPPHHIGLGQLYLALIVESLAQSPLWERCLLVITYDEHGGFFDHVPPPTLRDDYADDGFDQLGFRVPALVVGPWVIQGVDSTVYDNTSVLKYVCERWGIEPWNKRLKATASLGGCLDTDRMATGIPLDPPVIPPFSAPEVEDLPPECTYDIGIAIPDSHPQPELAEWVQAAAPHLDRTAEVPEIHARMVALGRKLGLIVDPPGESL